MGDFATMISEMELIAAAGGTARVHSTAVGSYMCPYYFQRCWCTFIPHASPEKHASSILAPLNFCGVQAQTSALQDVTT